MSDFAAESQALRNEVPVERQLTGSHRLLRFKVGARRTATGTPWRLDRYLHALLPTISRSMIQRWIVAGCATVDNQPGEPGQLLRPEQSVELRAPLPKQAPAEQAEAAMSILYHDRWLLVVDKPAGQLAHQAGRTMTGTLLNQARDWLEQRGGDPQEARLVNRIDRDTSGIVLISLAVDAHVTVSAALEAHDLYKEYRAICHGVPEPGSGSWREAIGEGPASSIARMVRPDGQNCHTDYEVLERTDPRLPEQYALMRIVLHTGRQHQIRVHAAHHGHALVGDWVYGRPCRELPGQALHAAVLEFPHPTERRRVRIEAPLPRPLIQLWTALQAGLPPTACPLSAEQRSKLGVVQQGEDLRRPSWLSAEEFAALREQTGE